ncbi:PIN domain-containing protein [Candidatus Pacearchaeota archaeon]|nr:PIN domain-containing protein [Candidatus Pacearchaeota archaeon]
MVCLETTFLIDFFRGNKEAIEKYKKIKESGKSLKVTAPSITEIISGASLNIKNEEKEKAIEFFSNLEILELNKKSAILSGEVEAELILSGETIGIIDILIGSICLSNNETLLTRNKKHFEKIKNLKIESY